MSSVSHRPQISRIIHSGCSLNVIVLLVLINNKTRQDIFRVKLVMVVPIAVIVLIVLIVLIVIIVIKKLGKSYGKNSRKKFKKGEKK